MIQYKDKPLINEEQIAALGVSTSKTRRVVLGKEIESEIFTINFLLFGSQFAWAFEDAKERDFVYANVLKEMHGIVKLDNF